MKQRLLEAAHGAAVQNTLPPVIHHELRQVHDQDVARRLLATAANVRDHGLHGIAVGRVDDRQRHGDVEGVPAVLHDLESRAVVVDGERLNRRGTRGTRIREGTHRGPAHAFHVHDGVHARGQGRHIRHGLGVQRHIHGFVNRGVTAVSEHHTSNHEGNHSKGEPGAGTELRDDHHNEYSGGDGHAQGGHRDIAQERAAGHLGQGNAQQAHAVTHHGQLHHGHGDTHTHNVQLNQGVDIRAEEHGEYRREAREGQRAVGVQAAGIHAAEEDGQVLVVRQGGGDHGEAGERGNRSDNQHTHGRKHQQLRVNRGVAVHRESHLVEGGLLVEVLPRRAPVDEEELGRVMHHVHMREVGQAQQAHQQNGGDDAHQHHGQGRVVLLGRAEVADRIGNRRHAGEGNRASREGACQ